MSFGTTPWHYFPGRKFAFVRLPCIIPPATRQRPWRCREESFCASKDRQVNVECLVPTFPCSVLQAQLGSSSRNLISYFKIALFAKKKKHALAWLKSRACLTTLRLCCSGSENRRFTKIHIRYSSYLKIQQLRLEWPMHFMSCSSSLSKCEGVLIGVALPKKGSI